MISNSTRRRAMVAAVAAGGLLIAAGAADAASTHSRHSHRSAKAATQHPGHWRGSPLPARTTTAPSATPTTSTATPSPSATSTAASSPTTSDPSGAAIPTANLAGWTNVFAEDFNSPVGLGGFDSSSYGSRWYTYSGPDSSGNGTYDTAKTVSVSGGLLDMYLHTANGQALSAAIVPQVPGSGQAYGRYSVRFRADSMQNYGAAFLLWPDSNDWNQGEIDFPEAPFNGTLSIHDHCIGSPQNSCYNVDTGISWTSWHTATTEWTPGLVKFYLDGNLVGQSNVSPTAKMHMVMQTGTDGGRPAASVSGHVQIDWVSIWARS